jgi:hypothetical protein
MAGWSNQSEAVKRLAGAPQIVGTLDHQRASKSMQ